MVSNHIRVNLTQWMDAAPEEFEDDQRLLDSLKQLETNIHKTLFSYFKIDMPGESWTEIETPQGEEPTTQAIDNPYQAEA